MKRGLVLSALIVIFIVLTLGIISAAENESTGIDTDDAEAKAYQCLKDQIKDKTLSFQEAVFTTLAIGDYSGQVVSSIDSEKKSSESCWPKSGCKIKETAQAALAYNRVGKGTGDIEKWLFSRNVTSTDIKWFLEIDITDHVQSNCTIKYDNVVKSVKILEDMSMRGDAGSCLTIDNYLLRISPNCLDKEIDVSCDQNFITTVLYQKNSGGTTFIPSETRSAASLGGTKEEVSAKCFKDESGKCDYEGTLWAAMALKKIGKDVSDYIPYLLALADDNQRFFPSAFIYILTGGDYSGIAQSQKQGKFWEVSGTPSSRYYDTSIAMMALSGTSAQELENAKSYLLSIQTRDGCWNNNNVRDTAFILYSGWSKPVAAVAGSSPATCDAPSSCENSAKCTAAGGTIFSNYLCLSPSEVCCSVAVAGQTCSQMSGVLCGANEVCEGGSKPAEQAADGTCCYGRCVESSEADACVQAGGSCKFSCDSGEVASSESCTGGDLCCKAESGSLWWLWVILLIILIGLVALGIVYREKVKLWWFKLTNKFKKKPETPAAPKGAYPPYGQPMQRLPQRMPQQMPMQRLPPRQPLKQIVKKDRDMEETLKKLKEMSK